MTKLIAVSVIALFVSPQLSHAKGCIEGAALGAVAGHMVHHTFLGLFGGCAGGMIVHHLYAKWKKDHPNGTLKEFVADNKDKLPTGWADRLSQAPEEAGPKVH